jgi:hypothetical protein
VPESSDESPIAGKFIGRQTCPLIYPQPANTVAP